MRRAARRRRLSRAHDADVVPHEAAELVPVLRDDDGLVARHRVADVPVRAPPATGLRPVDRGERQRGAVREDHALEQRVRREPVRAVQARVRALADRPEAGDRRAPVEVGRDAAADVVRGGDDGDRLRRDVDAVAQALGVDVGKVLLDEARGSLCVMSRSTCSAPVRFISWSIARATMSRGASSARGSYSFMNGVPSRRRRMAPSPRSASEMRKFFACGWKRHVGWNW